MIFIAKSVHSFLFINSAKSQQQSPRHYLMFTGQTQRKYGYTYKELGSYLLYTRGLTMNAYT